MDEESNETSYEGVFRASPSDALSQAPTGPSGNAIDYNETEVPDSLLRTDDFRM